MVYPFSPFLQVFGLLRRLFASLLLPPPPPCEASSETSAPDERVPSLRVPLHAGLLAYLSERYDLRFNLLTEMPECRPKNAAVAYERVDTVRLNSLTIEAIDAGLGVWARDVQRLLHSSMLPSYHPLTDFMASLPEWDGTDRVLPLARRVSGADVWCEGFAVWLRAMAAQWMGRETVTANDLVPLLVSRRQGLRKSTFCRLLMPHELRAYFTDKFDLTANAAVEPRLAKLGLINLDEFDRYTKRQNAMLKNLLQLRTLCVRRAYRQDFLALPRMASFIATSNETAPLTDASGSRRYLCVEVKRPIDCAPIDHAQLFAQLRREVHDGKPCYLDRAATERLERWNASFRAASPLAEVLSARFRRPHADESGEWRTATELFMLLRRRCAPMLRGVTLCEFGRALRSAGFVVRHTRRGNCYCVVKR